VTTFDTNGRETTKQQYLEGLKTSRRYDSLGRLVLVIQTDNAGEVVLIDTTEYISDSLIITLQQYGTDVGRKHIQGLDSRGNILYESIRDSIGNLEFEATTSFQIRNNGCLKASTVKTLNVDTESKSTIKRAYDQNGRVVRELFLPENTETRYSYDSSGAFAKIVQRISWGDTDVTTVDVFTNDDWGNPLYMKREITNLRPKKTIKRSEQRYEYQYYP
jgi:YD repeat-containing protein